MLIACASAEVPLDTTADLILRGLWMALKQLVGAEYHPWGAKSALEPMAFPKAFLNRMEFLALGESFYSQHLSPIRLDSKNCAGFHCHAI